MQTCADILLHVFTALHTRRTTPRRLVGGILAVPAYQRRADRFAARYRLTPVHWALGQIKAALEDYPRVFQGVYTDQDVLAMVQLR